jgi:hypothetical protein
LTIFRNSRLQPFLDQAKYPAIGRTARRGPAQAEATAQQKTENLPQYALGRIDFDSAFAQQPGYGVGPAYQRSRELVLRYESK